jgi:hypothetical protein
LWGGFQFRQAASPLIGARHTEAGAEFYRTPSIGGNFVNMVTVDQVEVAIVLIDGLTSNSLGVVATVFFVGMGVPKVGVVGGKASLICDLSPLLVSTGAEKSEKAGGE